MDKIDHDALIRIDEGVKGIVERLNAGAETLANHEKRIQAVENACTPRTACEAKHESLNSKYNILLLTLLGATMSIIATLLATR